MARRPSELSTLTMHRHRCCWASSQSKFSAGCERAIRAAHPNRVPRDKNGSLTMRRKPRACRVLLNWLAFMASAETRGQPHLLTRSSDSDQCKQRNAVCRPSLVNPTTDFARLQVVDRICFRCAECSGYHDRRAIGGQMAKDTLYWTDRH